MPVFQASRSGLVCSFVGCVVVRVGVGCVIVRVGVGDGRGGCSGWVFRRATACVTSSGPFPTWMLTTCPAAFTDGVPGSSTFCFDVVGVEVVVLLELRGTARGLRKFC